MGNPKYLKGNRRSLKKLIALWVVFAMLVVPFAGNLGEKEVARAASDVVINNIQTYTQTVNLNIVGNDFGEIVTNSSRMSITLLKEVQKLKIELAITDGVPAPPTYTIKYKLTNDSGYREIEPGNVITIDNPETVNSGKNFIITIFSCHGSNYNTQRIVDVKLVDAFTAEDGIYASADSGTPFADGAYTASAYLKAGSEKVTDVATAHLRYYVGTTDLTEKTVATSYDRDSNTFGKDDFGNETVHAYAAIISDNGTTDDTTDDVVLAYEKLGSVRISDDTSVPTVAGELQAWNGSAYETLSPAEQAHIKDGIYYGISEKYRYAIMADDIAAGGEEASGIDKVSLSIGGISHDLTMAADGNYYYEMTAADVQTADGASVKVIATDKVGNGANHPITLTSIKHVTAGTTVSSVTIDGETWDGIKYIPKQTTQKTISVTVNTTENITGLQLSYGTGGGTIDKTGELQSGTVGEDTRSHTVTANFNIPDDLEVSRKYESIKVLKEVDGNGSFTQVTGTTISDILYDATAPAISELTLQKSTDGVTWADVAGTDTITTELGYQYRYKIKVTEPADESGIGKVYLSDTDSSTNFTLDSGYWYWKIPADKLNTTTAYAPTVYAKDKAGNISDGVELRGIKKLDDALKITNLCIKNASGTDVTSTFSSRTIKYAREQYTLTVNVSSAYSITDVKLYSDKYSGGKNPTASISNTYDSVTHRYSSDVTFELLEGMDVNDAVNSMYIIAQDQNRNEKRYPSTAGTYIGNILYDRTIPTLAITKTVDTVWHRNFSLGYTIKSGDAAVESPLKNGTVRYTLSDCVNNVADGQIAVNGIQTSVSSGQAMIVPQSTSINGTLLTFAAQDSCENGLPATSYRIKVDSEAPQFTLFDVNGKTILSDALEGDVVIRANVSDNLTIASATIQVTGPDTNVTKTLCEAGERVGIGSKNTFTLSNLIGKQAVDGDYTVTVKASDKAGNAAPDRTISFTVDNTIPVVTAKIANGTTAGKQPGQNFDGTLCDYYYSSNVEVLLTYEDDNLSTNAVNVTDNGNSLNLRWSRVGSTNKYQAVYTATQDGAHTIRIGARDGAGNNAVTKQVVFIKDTKAPTITAVFNGGVVYSEAMGEINLTSASSLNLSVSDANEDVADFNYQLVKTLPDALPVTADYIKTNNRGFSYTDEADYVVNVYAVDKAGNRSPARSIRFRVDTAAPELKISGAGSGSSLSSGTTLTFTMTEAFWRDASGTVTITRKAGDGASEAAYKTIDFKPTARTTNLSETLSETGEYKVTFTAKDRAGHTSEAAAYTVRIDTDKPVITLNGVSNNDKTTGEVEFLAQIQEDFYLTKSISIQATRTYLDTLTNEEKTEDIRFTGYNSAASDTIIRSTFTNDGIYEIQITCKDAAGNEDVQEVSFIIDKSEPAIDAKVLAAYEGTLAAFTWDYDIYDLVYDLTVCDVHMYLNGSEYDGTSEIEDGVYEMKITAEDELGNYQEQITSFTLDTKAPTFIVTGVEDGEVKNEQYSIDVSLQLDEDVLDSVTLNGETIEIKDNKATLAVSDKGDYKLTMTAHDAAGNEAEKTISFTYGEQNRWWIFLIIGVAGIAVIGGIIFAVGRRKK